MAGMKEIKGSLRADKKPESHARKHQDSKKEKFGPKSRVKCGPIHPKNHHRMSSEPIHQPERGESPLQTQLLIKALWRCPWVGPALSNPIPWMIIAIGAVIAIVSWLLLSPSADRLAIGQALMAACASAAGISLWQAWAQQPQAIALIAGAAVGAALHAGMIAWIWIKIGKSQSPGPLIETVLEAAIVDGLNVATAKASSAIRALHREGKASQIEQLGVALLAALGSAALGLLTLMAIISALAGLMLPIGALIVAGDTLLHGGALDGIDKLETLDRAWLIAQALIGWGIALRWERQRRAGQSAASPAPKESLGSRLKNAATGIAAGAKAAPAMLVHGAQRGAKKIAQRAIENSRASGALAEWEKDQLEREAARPKARPESDKKKTLRV